MALNLNPEKRHIVFYHAITSLCFMGLPDGLSVGFVSYIDPGLGFDAKLNDFDTGMYDVLLVPRSHITGWRTWFTADQCDVHFLFAPSAEEFAQGTSRVTSNLQVKA